MFYQHNHSDQLIPELCVSRWRIVTMPATFELKSGKYLSILSSRDNFFSLASFKILVSGELFRHGADIKICC
jgi:hypothetical protein